MIYSREMLEFMTDEIIFLGLSEIRDIITSPRIRTENIAKNEIKVLETTPDVKVRALSAVIQTKRLLMMIKDAEEREKDIEIPDEYSIGDG